MLAEAVLLKAVQAAPIGWHIPNWVKFQARGSSLSLLQDHPTPRKLMAFDLRRVAVVHNLHALARQEAVRVLQVA
ncbi:hypothetical protein [Gloeobacter kilaueensis]|uniref:Uncharacterized protein n=1 Tax=Gloeobacter kilaueensis (strain ATCC BAA-2537 / CCAP 1431/1 / ULC 316 / JS1) TaxID=1183438 RepID=U5QQ47_GLOK1|nr:hypothetical protein [Gloeobacter kilaueensis]AGY59764.1 hypothetical protein GKIL_3518 [Gloeobacter kilaueensis JS1]